MVLYKIKRSNGQEIDIFIAQEIDNDSSNTLIIYESPGSDGGFIVNTGRNNEKLVITGKIVAQATLSATPPLPAEIRDQNARSELSEIVTLFQNIKNNREIIQLLGPISNASVSKWQIGRFGWTIPQGSGAYVEFTLELIEYRQVNYNKTSINMVGGEAVRTLRAKFEEQQQISSL